MIRFEGWTIDHFSPFVAQNERFLSASDVVRIYMPEKGFFPKMEKIFFFSLLILRIFFL